MNKGEFISAVAEQANCSKKQASEVFEAMQTVIIDTLKNREKIAITGFGNFEVKHRNERTGRNPQTNENITIPAKDVPSFKPGKLLKEAL